MKCPRCQAEDPPGTKFCRQGAAPPRVSVCPSSRANNFAQNKFCGQCAAPLDKRAQRASAAVQVYGLTDFHAKNALALGRLKTEFSGKVEVRQLPFPVLRELRKMAAEVVREESEKTPMARRVHASFTKFQALVGPWDHAAEGAYHQFVAI